MASFWMGVAHIRGVTIKGFARLKITLFTVLLVLADCAKRGIVLGLSTGEKLAVIRLRSFLFMTDMFSCLWFLLVAVYVSDAAKSIAPTRLAVSQSSINAAKAIARTKIPTFSKIFQATSLNSIEGTYSDGGCDIVLAVTGSCQVSAHTSCLTVGRLLSAFLRGVSLTSLLDRIGEKDGRSSWKVTEITINWCKKRGSFRFSTSGRIQIDPTDVRHVILDPFLVEVSFTNLVSPLHVVYMGTWKIGTVSLPVAVMKDSDGLHLSTTTVKLPSTINDFIASAGSKTVGYYPIFPKGKVSTVVSYFTEFNNINVVDVSAVGEILSTGNAYRLNVGLTALKVPVELYITVITFANGTQIYHAGFDFPTTKLASLIKKFTPIDLSGIPVLKDLAVEKPSILISLGNTSAPFIAFPSSSNLNNMGPVEEGMAVVFQGKFSGSAASTFLIRYKAPSKNSVGTLKFKLSGAKPKASALINIFLKQFGSITLPPMFKIDSFISNALDSFEYDAYGKTFTVGVSLGSNVQIIPKALSFVNPKITFKINVGPSNASTTSSPSSKSLSKSVGGRVTVTISTTIEIGSVVIKMSFSKPAGSSIYVASGSSTSSIPIGKLLEKFALSLLPSALDPLAKKANLDAFEIADPAVKIVFAQKPAFSLSGRTVISSFDKCLVQVIMGQTESTGSLVGAAGLVLEKVKVSKVIKTMTSLDISKVPGTAILDHIVIGILMSSEQIPKNEKYLAFNLPTFQNVQIMDGITLASTFSLPSDCGKDIFCNILKRFFPVSMVFKLAGRMTANSINLKATIPTTIKIITGLSMTNLGLEVQVGTKNSIGVTGEMDFKNPNLHFTGGFGMSSSGGYLKMATIGTWENAFGLKFIAISNLNFDIAVVPDPILVSALQLGGTVRIGFYKDPKAVPITASVYIGIDRTNALENYFYGNINTLTCAALLKAFGKSLNLPKPIANTGFPNGLLVSMSAQGRVLPTGLAIDRGFYMKGTLNIFGLKLKSDVRINLNGIYIDLRATPLKLANNLIKVTGLKSNEGPRVHIDLRWNPPRSLLIIQGSVTLLGMTRTVDVKIDHRSMYFKITGKMFRIFDASLELTATYSSLHSAAFRVKGSFKQDLFVKLRNGVKNALNNVAKDASRKIEREQKKVRDQIAKVGSLTRTFENQKRHFYTAANKVAHARAKVNKERKKVDAARKKYNDKINEFRRKSCGRTQHCRYRRSIYEVSDLNENENVAKKFLRRKKRWGRWRVRVKSPREIWREGKERVYEGIRKAKRVAQFAACKARNVAISVCNGVKNGLARAASFLGNAVRVAEIPFRAAQGTLIITERGLKESRRVMDGAKGFVYGAKLVLKAYERSLEGVKQANKFGMNVATKIAQAGLGGLIDIRELTFDLQLALMKGGSFSVRIRVSFFGGSPKIFGLRINVYSISSMVKALVNKAKDAMLKLG